QAKGGVLGAARRHPDVESLVEVVVFELLREGDAEDGCPLGSLGGSRLLCVDNVLMNPTDGIAGRLIADYWMPFTHRRHDERRLLRLELPYDVVVSSRT